MNKPPLVPPIKCQGIKTKIVGDIIKLAESSTYRRWVEPFCGSCVVALNVKPQRALLNDTNIHIIRLYQEIQAGRITGRIVRQFLMEQGEKLVEGGEKYYYEVRTKFNEAPEPLDFLFLNRSCFNGVMRFNRKGGFNVPFGHKPHRFAQSYITKIVNQVDRLANVMDGRDWTFTAGDFRTAVESLSQDDLVYADPPYAGRHVDYFNSWSDEDEKDLTQLLKTTSADFILSTWHSNEYRTNGLLTEHWSGNEVRVLTKEHFYHVGSTESLRRPMIEALVTSLPAPPEATAVQPVMDEQLLLLEA